MRTAAIALTLVTCGGGGAPPVATVTATRDLGPLAFVPSVRGRDGGYSAGWAGRSVWDFGDTVLSSAATDGETWRSSTFCTTTDLDATDNLAPLDEPLDAAGAPGEFLPFTADEQAFNDAHFSNKIRATCTDDCGARWALWPGPVVPDPAGGGALVFYAKVSARPGPYNFDFVGTSVATWASPDARPVRPALRPDAAEPTLLFDGDEPNLAAAALTVGDQLYAYACSGAGFSAPCVLARAPWARATERAAWTFLGADDQWTTDARAAKTVLDGATMMTVAWNEALGAYAAIYSAPASSDLLFRTAPAPEGPWSDAQLLLHAMRPTNPDAWTYSGLAHAELARDDGLTQVVSYFRETGFLAGELRLVEVTLAKR
ncbi:MAG: hypothetical protein JWM82_2699 [Myxococcales bacterium]|nr:hypothetical protein [Myxococcales bacterium]